MILDEAALNLAFLTQRDVEVSAKLRGGFQTPNTLCDFVPLREIKSSLNN
jgi:hypothetical protein